MMPLIKDRVPVKINMLTINKDVATKNAFVYKAKLFVEAIGPYVTRGHF
jgi:hypothetical protein